MTGGDEPSRPLWPSKLLTMKYIFIYAVCALTLLSGCTTSREPRCVWNTRQHYGFTYIEKQKFVHGFRWVDMGGSSDNLTLVTRGFISPRDFRFTPVDTKEPKIRMVRNVVSAHVKLRMSSNDDTGEDYLEVYTENGKLLFSMEFGQFEEAEFSFSFSSPTTIFFRVSNASMPNGTPGAFQTTVLVRGVFAQKQYVRVRIVG